MSEKSFCEHLASQLSTAHRQVKPCTLKWYLQRVRDSEELGTRQSEPAGAWRTRPRARGHTGHLPE